MRDEIGLYSSFYFTAFRPFVADLICQQRAAGPHCKAQCHAAQNVGGEMHIQVHPREADEPGQHKSRDAEPAVLQPECEGSGKGGGCVSGREGLAMGPGHQCEHLRPEVAGARACEQWL